MASDVLTTAVRGLVRERDVLAKTIQRCTRRCDDLRGLLDEVTAEHNQARARMREIDEVLVPLRNIAPTTAKPARVRRHRQDAEGLILGALEGQAGLSRIRLAAVTELPTTALAHHLTQLVAAGAIERVSRGVFRLAGVPAMRVV